MNPEHCILATNLCWLALVLAGAAWIIYHQNKNQ